MPITPVWLVTGAHILRDALLHWSTAVWFRRTVVTDEAAVVEVLANSFGLDIVRYVLWMLLLDVIQGLSSMVDPSLFFGHSTSSCAFREFDAS